MLVIRNAVVFELLSARGIPLVPLIRARVFFPLMKLLYKDSNTANSDERARRREHRAKVRDQDFTGVHRESNATRGEAQAKSTGASGVSITAHVNEDHDKTQSVDQQDEHHRGAMSPSSSEDLRSELLRHSNRPEVDVDEIAKKPRIDWPKPGDKIWATVDKEIKEELDMVFNRRAISRMTPSDLSARFDNWAYDFFAARFGVVATKDNHQAKICRPKRVHKGLEELRRRKNECTKAFRALKKAGLAETPEGLTIARQMKVLVRKHNRMRVRLAAGQFQRAKRAQQEEFRKDPNGFAQKLFKGERSNAAPTFDKEAGINYFK